jgi:hypothetical protein
VSTQPRTPLPPSYDAHLSAQQHWSDARATLRAAREALFEMKHAPHQRDRDRACARYVAEVDTLVAALAALADAGCWEMIGACLAVAEGDRG